MLNLKINVKILLFCTVFVAKGAFAQINRSQPAPKPVFYRDFSTAWRHISFQIPPQLPVQQMAFPCRVEWKMENRLRIPLRIRVGSLSYCNWLEQKPNAGRAYPLP